MINQIVNLAQANLDQIRSFATLVAGSAGRLVISLFYFILVANTLSVDEFGLFATASATGIILSRFFAFGFVSPIYRIATAKNRLLGAYTAGLIVGGLLSIPIILIIATGAYFALFKADMLFISFMAIVIAEVIFWRSLEVTIIILNGLNRFVVAASLVVFGTFAKMLAALGFTTLLSGSLDEWALCYLGANIISCLVGVGLFYPRVALRWRPDIYIARWVDSTSVASAEIVFYAQAEFDKLIVLAVAGPKTAGIYAILMRLVDLTALPIRSLITLLVQKIMRSKKLLRSFKNIALIELSIGAISTLGILAMAVMIYIFPNILGENIADVAPYLFLVLLVPCFRNLTEYHSEIMYAVNLTVRRTINAAALGLVKALILYGVFSHSTDENDWLWILNFTFMALYVTSVILTYPPIHKVVPIQRKQA